MLFAAASEKLADNVYYMNNIKQPSGAKKGIPNLAKIIAMRSVGVVNQVNDEEAWVCTYGCDLSTLGNAVKGEAAKSGLLTAVDTATGIYVTAKYAGGKNSSAIGKGFEENLFQKNTKCRFLAGTWCI